MEAGHRQGRQPVVARRRNVFPSPIGVLTCSGSVAGIGGAVREIFGVLSYIPITLEQVEYSRIHGCSFGGWGCLRNDGGKGGEPANVFGEHVG